MINKEDTTFILNKFFEDCFAFWVNEGRNDREAFKLALSETSELKRNPFDPMGDFLDLDAKEEYLTKMQREL